MKARFWRIDGKRRTLHRASCPLLTWRAKLMGKAHPWMWANDKPARVVSAVLDATGVDACHVCQPLSVQYTGSTR